MDVVLTVRTCAEIDCAIRALTPAQWGRLRQLAGLRALGRPIEAKDLLQEAFRRALDGKRKWPATVDIVGFIDGAMQSIADGELKRARRRPRPIPMPDYSDPASEGAEPAEPAPRADEALEDAEQARQTQAKIDALFGDDPEAQVIVEGIMEGHKGEDLRLLTDLEPKTYQSKRRLILRRIGKYKESPS